MNQRRLNIAKRYKTELPTSLFEHQQIGPEVVSNYHVFVSRLKTKRQEFVAYMDQKGVQTNIYYLNPLHKQKAFANISRIPVPMPVVEALCESVVALPMYPEMPEENLTKTIETISAFKPARVNHD